MNGHWLLNFALLVPKKNAGIGWIIISIKLNYYE